MELHLHHNENEYLGETLLDDVSPLSIGTRSEKCIIVVHFRFLRSMVEQKITIFIKVMFKPPMLIIPKC